MKAKLTSTAEQCAVRVRRPSLDDVLFVWYQKGVTGQVNLVSCPSLRSLHGQFRTGRQYLGAVNGQAQLSDAAAAFGQPDRDSEWRRRVESCELGLDVHFEPFARPCSAPGFVNHSTRLNHSRLLKSFDNSIRCANLRIDLDRRQH